MLPQGDFTNLPTPCYIIDEERFVRGIREFRDALDRWFSHNAIGYSVKTNSLPWLIKKANAEGCHAEVVSADEYQLARLCGFSPDRVVYNGIMKSKSTMMECIAGGGIVNLDSWKEIEWILETGPFGRGVGLRLKSNYSEVSPDDCTGINDDSRFGFSDEAGEFGKAVNLLSEAGIAVEGIHIHRTTSRRSVDYYRNAARYAARVAKKHGLQLKYIDIGGGFYGIFPGKPTFIEYSKAIHEVLSEEGMEDVALIVEPGSAVSAWCMKLLSSVTDTRVGSDGLIYVTLDASRNDVDPFFRKKGYMLDFRYQPGAVDRPEAAGQLLCGCTCLEDDRFLLLEDTPRLLPGDLVCFNRVGAYTMTLSGQFIRLLPAVYVWENDHYVQVRRRTEAADMLIW